MSLNQLLLPLPKNWLDILAHSISGESVTTNNLTIQNISNSSVANPSVGSQTIFGNSDLANNLTSKDSSGNNISLSSSLSNFIVGDGMQYQTIQSAIDAASLTGNTELVLIKPGTYNESLTLKANVSLSCCGIGQSIQSSPVVINGEMTVNYLGSVQLSNLQLNSTNQNCVLVNMSNATSLVINNCSFNNSGSGDCIHIDNTNSQLFVSDCVFNSNSVSGYFVNAMNSGNVNVYTRCVFGSLGPSFGKLNCDNGIIAIIFSVLNAQVYTNSGSAFAICINNFFSNGDFATFIMNNGLVIAVNNFLLDNASSGTDFITGTGNLIKSLFTLSSRTTVGVGIVVSSLTVF